MIDAIKSKIGKWMAAVNLSSVTMTRTPIFVVDIETWSSDDLPGDVPVCPRHGICGIAVSNMFGDSVYLVIDRPGVIGIPIDHAIAFLNAWSAQPGALMIVHHGKFDLGFLVVKGLDISKVRLIDTWLASAIGNQGIFKSNKLKESIRERHGIETSTEEEKDKFFADNKTKDYGRLPLELIAPYACDDVRYALILSLTNKASVQEMESHDLYMRNCLHLNKAEARGFCVDLPKMKLSVAGAENEYARIRQELITQLNGIVIDPDNDQQMFKHLHSSGLYSEPRSWFGETKYVFDPDLMETLFHIHPIVEMYYWQYQRGQFLKYFSPRHGQIANRIFQNERGVGINIGQHISVAKKGGMPLMKFPDFDHSMLLTQELRSLFIASKGYKLVTVSAVDVPLQMLLFYLQEKRFENNPADFLKFMIDETRLKPVVVQNCIRGIYEGWGNKVLAQRLARKGVKGLAGNPHYAWKDEVESKLPNFANVLKNIKAAIKSQNGVRDRLGRFLQIEPKSEWRAFAILMQSSVGSVYSATLDTLCRIADKTGAYLVGAHHNEFIFEVPENNDAFIAAIRPGMEQHATWTPLPKLGIAVGSWSSGVETLGRDY